MSQLQRFAPGDKPAETPFDKNIERTLLDLIDKLREILNAGILFTDNVNCQLTSVTSPGAPGTEIAVPHTLKRVPTGYIVYRKDKAGNLYDGASAWTASNIYVKSDIASLTAYVIIF